MHILTLGLLRVRNGGPVTLEDLRTRLAVRLDQLPAFRWRLVPVPFGLASPAVVEDPQFDIEKHVCHAVLPAPGGREELDAACAQLAAKSLDRDRPLWRITLIDGLAGGRQALALETHHALMDGFAVLATLARIFSAEEEPAGSPDSWHPGRIPGRMQLVAGALVHHAKALPRLPGLVGRTRRGRRAVRERLARTTVTVPKPGVDVPMSAINSEPTPERRFAQVSLPLDEVLLVREIAGVTVNDVALALVGGALRGYLHARGALPDRPLVASVPVLIRETTATPRTQGNRVSSLTASLATDVADPWERLHRISAVTAEAKACVDLLGRELPADWLECIPPVLLRPMLRRKQEARWRSGKRQVKLADNVVVSNLRGPAVPWQLGSAVVEEIYMAPPGIGVGINFLLWDYAGRLMFGILSFAGSVEDPRELAVQLSRCLDELVAAAERRRVPTA